MYFTEVLRQPENCDFELQIISATHQTPLIIVFSTPPLKGTVQQALQFCSHYLRQQCVLFILAFKSFFGMHCAGIFKQSMGARNRVGIVLSYRPARLHRLAELIPWNRFLGSLTVKNWGSALKNV
jgi:hypothetical protein